MCTSTMPQALLLLLVLVLLAAAAAARSAGPVVTVLLHDPRSLQGTLDDADVLAAYQTRVPSLDCHAGVDWSFKRDSLVPSRVWVKKARQCKRNIVNLVARFDRLSQVGHLDINVVMPTTTVTTFVNTKQEIGPVRVATGFDVDGRRVDVAVLHDLTERTGSMAINAAVRPGTSAQLTLQAAGDVSFVVMHQRRLDRNTKLVCNVDAVPLLTEGLDAFGTNFASVRAIKSLDDSSSFSVGVNDRRDVSWRFQTGAARTALDVSGALFFDGGGKAPKITIRHTTQL